MRDYQKDINRIDQHGKKEYKPEKPPIDGLVNEICPAGQMKCPASVKYPADMKCASRIGTNFISLFAKAKYFTRHERISHREAIFHSFVSNIHR
jgi:hypothetical protein